MSTEYKCNISVLVLSNVFFIMGFYRGKAKRVTFFLRSVHIYLLACVINKLCSLLNLVLNLKPLRYIDN